jgi:hypothetical protein
MGQREKRRRDFQAERFGGLHVEEEFKGCRLLDLRSTGLAPLRILST